jgi:hypothetical protein
MPMTPPEFGKFIADEADLSSMSALGHKRTLTHIRSMFALPPKADIDGRAWRVR